MVAPRAILLSGEHPSLPLAELRALLDVHDPGATVEDRGPVALIRPASATGTDAALARMALGHEWGEHWGTIPETAEGLTRLTSIAKPHGPRTGSAAVVATRRGTHHGLLRLDVERAFGKVLEGLGHTVDLVHPAHAYFAWLDAGHIHVGERRASLDRASHDLRNLDERAHFSPVSLHPRRAAALLHLARVPPGGRVLDPFCGTGAFVLEAALEGYEAIGSDIDPFMAQGTLQSLADNGPAPLDGVVLEADIAAMPDLVDPVHGILADFPYGRASSSHDEDLAGLYDRAFAAFQRLLAPGGHAVVGCAQPELLPDLARHGFVEVERHAERIHKSLTRHFVVARRAS